MTTANDILMGGGGKFATFTAHNDSVTGQIVNIGEPYQVREWNQATGRSDGPPKFTKAGKPIYAFHVTLATSQRDPMDGDDDGIRVLDVNSWRMKDAIRDACRKAGAAQGLAVGGQLTVTYTRDEVPGDARSGKHYSASYVAGANADLMGEQQAATPAPAAPAPQATRSAPQPAATPDPAALAAFEAWQAQQAGNAHTA